MLHHAAMPCHALPSHTMLGHVMLCHAMLFHAMLCHAIPCHAVPCCAILHRAVPCLLGCRLRLLLYLLKILYKAIEQGGSSKQGCPEGVEEEQKKGFVVQEANTVQHPDAVVVHLEDTAACHGIVVCSDWLPCLCVNNMLQCDRILCIKTPGLPQHSHGQ